MAEELTIKEIISRTGIANNGTIAEGLRVADKTEEGRDDKNSSYWEFNNYYLENPARFKGINANVMGSFLARLKNIAPGASSPKFSGLESQIVNLERMLEEYSQLSRDSYPFWRTVTTSREGFQKAGERVKDTLIQLEKLYSNTQTWIDLASRYNTVIDHSLGIVVTGYSYHNGKPNDPYGAQAYQLGYDYLRLR